MATNLVSNAIVREFLTKDNYANWSVCVKNYLVGQGLWDAIKSEAKIGEKKNAIGEKKNAMALHAIQISCEPGILSYIREIDSAKATWDFLAKMYEPQSKERKVSEQGSSSGKEVRRRKPLVGTERRDYVQPVDLHKAVINDNWVAVDSLFKSHNIGYGAEISLTGKTALHAAVIAGRAKIVEKLVQNMTDEELEKTEEDGWTALMAAALTGNTEMAKCMVGRNTKLPTIPAKKGMIPVVVASAKGHKDMVRYLKKKTPREELTGQNEKNGAMLLSNCIVIKLFDVALDMLKHDPLLAFALNSEGASPVFILAQTPPAFLSGSHLAFWQRWICSCICVQPPRASDDTSIDIDEAQTDKGCIAISVFGQLRGLLSNLLEFIDPGFKQIYDTKLIHVQACKLLHDHICEEIPKLTDRQRKEGLVYKAIFQAVKHGIVEFITAIMEADPDLLSCTDIYKRDIFQCAIIHRQEKIFSLLYGFGARKNSLTSRIDGSKNNMLHLAGMPPPSSRLDHISGAALQMQRELQWFKEVERVVPLKFKEDKNSDGKTPQELFTENHKELVKEGEKWMKGTASSCSVVAALIVTIMFAAAFTVPGGNHQDDGSPIFFKKTSFKVFIASDAISFFSSSTSVLVFLGILTSRYAEEYFLESLPKKMIIGLTTLFVSIASMTTAFCAALFLMLKGQSVWVFILIILLASVPVILFILLQFPLLVEIFISTYGSGIFNKKRKQRNFNILCNASPLKNKSP